MSTPTTPLTAEAQRAQQTGTTTLTPPITKPATPVSAASLAQQVNRAQAVAVPVPAGLVSESTTSIISPWMRGMIYGETNARKTTLSAEFGTVDSTRIILTRGKDQLRPLQDRDYKFALCDNMQKLRYAMQFPEQLWPGWADKPDPLLVIDDITRVKEMLLEDNEVDDKGNERKDMRMVHREAKTDMGEMMRGLFRKPIHIIAIAFAAIYDNKITREESITPDLPPAMSRLLTADFSYVFFIDKSKWMLVTTDRRETYRQKNEKNVEETHTRVTFAKRKLPKSLEGKGVVNDLEKMDLQDIWTRIRNGKAK